MSRIHAIALCLGLVAALTTAPLGFAAADEKSSDEPAKAAKRSGPPMFKPTNVGTPSTRLGGATRGLGQEVRTEALVPEQAGQTLLAQPVLYWYLSGKTDHRIDFALIGVDPIKPLVEATLPKGLEPGIQRIRLADYDVKLEPGISYQWFIRVIPNPDQRLYDRVVGGGIERVAESDALEKELAAAAPGDSYYVLADAGIWYDAFDALNQRIAAAPGDADLVSQRSALLEQVGLSRIE